MSNTGWKRRGGIVKVHAGVWFRGSGRPPAEPKLYDYLRVGETATAIELRQSGEYSILGGVAFSLSESLTQVLRWVYWWNSTEELPDDVSDSQVLIQLNTDFSTKGLASQEVQAIVAAWQAGAMSRDSMFDLFRRGRSVARGPDE